MLDIEKKFGGKFSRRDFLQKGAIAAAGLTILPSLVMGQKVSGKKSPSDKLNIAAIGVGGRGAEVLEAIKEENIVALCDVDWKYAEETMKKYPKAKLYKDYRKMYSEMGKSFDAVVIATPDHMHAIMASEAIIMGKHVYCEKPLTHTVYESRLLTKLASKYKVATQMGNQGSSELGVRQTCEWLWNGEIGEVNRVEAFTDRPIWPQGLPKPYESMPIPETLDWNLFIGTAPIRDYNAIYHPWNWRGWWDFGTGALGDMACHILHPVFKGLKLSYPIKAQGSSTMLLTDCAPQAEMVKLTFPARDNMPKLALPEVEVTWYDGGIRPLMPVGFPDEKSIYDNMGGGVIFYGSKDTLICSCYGRDPWLLSGRKPSVPKFLREVTLSHEADWVRACKESNENRVETTSPFSEAGPFNEMVVMGVLAVRLQGLDKELLWDGENMNFLNISDSDKIQTIIQDGFKIHNGHPTFDKKMTDPTNAKQFADEMIKHNYQNGYKLPEMPV